MKFLLQFAQRMWVDDPPVAAIRDRGREPGSRTPATVSRLIALTLGLLIVVGPLPARAADDDASPMPDLRGDGGGEVATSELEKEIAGSMNDFDRLNRSHLSDVWRWQGVRPTDPAAATNQDYAWKIARTDQRPPRVLVSPLSSKPIHTLIAVPDKGEYRVWLGYEAEPGKTHPVTLALRGANDQKFTYGEKALTSASGAEQEKAGPFCFETEVQRLAQCTQPTVVWEYRDMTLAAGKTTLELSADDQAALVDAVFLTASKSLRPSKSYMQDDDTLHRTFYRVRVTEAGDGKRTYTMPKPALGYHWPRFVKGMDQPTWGGTMGDKDKIGLKAVDGNATIKVGEWTRWLDASENVGNSPTESGGGPWATGHFEFQGLTSGKVEIQAAWYKYESALLRTVKATISEGSTICLIPMEPTPTPPVATNDTDAVWGLRTADLLARFESAEDVERRHLQWAEEALRDLGIKEGQPTPKLIQLFSGCNPVPAARPLAQRMLVKLGLNSIGITDPALLKEFGQEPFHFIGANDSQYLCWTHDPLDPTAERNFEATLRTYAKDIKPPDTLVRLKMGDEIGAVTGEAGVNGFQTCRKAFHDYLRAQLKQRGVDASFLGVPDVDELQYVDDLPANPGLFERRLYYFCARFRFILTAMYYAQITRAAERVFPRVQTYCNFSPHPSMFGQQMNGSDWFALARNGGANMAWGEDWAGGYGGWGFTGFDVVSYYGAWVECAGRPHHNALGFYNVSTMGGADKKMFSLVNRGVFNIHVYDWGPMYLGGEGANFWSESKEVYKEVARGAHALGPADTIIVKGRREPRRAALLYNRSHEIWNSDFGGFQTDRLLTFLALMHAHIPTDIILEEDLTAENLKSYKVLYLQGFNLAKEQLAVVAKWVQEGGVVVGEAGTGMRDEFDEESAAGEQLFGARQRQAGVSEGGWHPQSLPAHVPIDKLTLTASDLTPEMKVDVIGVKCVLTPTTGKSVGTFADGSCGAVYRSLGKGKTLLLGVMPGHIYKGKTAGGSKYTLELRPLVTLPAEKALGTQRVEFSEPLTEVCLFEHESGLAVTLCNFVLGAKANEQHATLSVQTDREIKEVFAALAGPLKWKRAGDRIVIDLFNPETVDTVILR